MGRALASHQCVPGSIPGPGVICGLSLLLFLFLAPRGFSPGTPVFPSPQKPTFPNSNSIWNCQSLYHEPLARVIAQAIPVFDIKFTFLPLTFTVAIGIEFLSRRACNPGTLVITDRVLAPCPPRTGMLPCGALVDI